MDLTVVDYSNLCFAVLQKTRVPPRREGKFVVIGNGRERFAVFSPRELSVYHANIVERFMLDRGIRGQYNLKGDVYYFDAPAWTVEGGALWRFDRQPGILEIFGRSGGYGGLDLEEVACQLRAAGAFDRAEVAAIP
jgi:hypothetical protein